MHMLFALLLYAVPALGGVAVQDEEVSAFDRLVEEYDQTYRAWRERALKVRNEGTEEEFQAVYAQDPTREFIQRAVAASEPLAGTAEAFPYLEWVFEKSAKSAEHGPAHLALDRLLKHHLQDERLPDLSATIGYVVEPFSFDRPRALDALQKIAEAVPDKEDKAAALYWRAYAVATTRSTQAERDDVIGDLAFAIQEADAKIQPRAEHVLWVLQNLQIGMVAPDIEGTDLDGVAFKLSDYRGKVVMLDFWGDW